MFILWGRMHGFDLADNNDAVAVLKGSHTINAVFGN